MIVGVNKYADGHEPPVIATPDYSALEHDQVRAIGQGQRKARDAPRGCSSDREACARPAPAICRRRAARVNR